MDYQIFRLINEWAGQHGWLDTAMVVAARYGSLLFVVTLVWLWGMRGGRGSDQDRLAVGRALAAAGLALGLGQIIIRALPRARPFSSHSVHLLLPPSPDPSFPSDHALAAFAIAAAIAPTRRRCGVTLFGVGGLMGVARVFVGTHYPLDVLGGAALGTLSGIVLARADTWLQPLVGAPAAGPMPRSGGGTARRMRSVAADVLRAPVRESTPFGLDEAAEFRPSRCSLSARGRLHRVTDDGGSAI